MDCHLIILIHFLALRTAHGVYYSSAERCEANVPHQLVIEDVIRRGEEDARLGRLTPRDATTR